MSNPNPSCPSSESTRDKNQIGGLAKGLRLIEAFDSAHTRLTASEAARRVGISPAAARRCLLTLCEMGYAQTDGKHYGLWHGALRVAYAYTASTRLPRLVQPALDALCERCRDSASLAVLGDGFAVIAARSTARRTLRLGLCVGSRLPLHCSAAGRVLLSALPRAEADALLRAQPRERFTAHTVTELRELHALLDTCRTTGHAECDEEIELGVRSIAVPLRDAAGRTVAAMTLSTRADRLTLAEMLRQYKPLLLKQQDWAQARMG